MQGRRMTHLLLQLRRTCLSQSQLSLVQVESDATFSMALFYLKSKCIAVAGCGYHVQCLPLTCRTYNMSYMCLLGSFLAVFLKSNSEQSVEMLQGLSISHVKVVFFLGACDCWIGDPSGTFEVAYLCATRPIPTFF